MMLDAVDQAIQQAKYHERPFDRERVGVVVGTIFGGDYSCQLLMGLRLPEFQELLDETLRQHGIPDDLIEQLGPSYKDILLRKMPALLDETGSFTSSALASRITKSFNLMGGAVAVDSGRGSALAALSCCVDLLRAGDCDMMICVGGQNDMTPSLYAATSMEGRLAAGPVVSPFDRRADGTVPGEGCGALLLKRLSDARRDNDPILGIIRGIGSAYDVVAEAAATEAVNRALADAGVAPADVSVVETTPCEAVEADMVELLGIADAYSDRGSQPPLAVGSVVAQIGDTSGASGIASFLAAAMEVESASVPPDPALTQASPHVTRHSSVLKVPTGRPAPLAGNAEGRLFAGIHCSGQREVSYHVILERGTKLKPIDPSRHQAKPSTAAPRTDAQIIEFDATQRRRDRKRTEGSARVAPVRPEVQTPSNGASHEPRVPASAPVSRVPAPQRVQKPVTTHQPPSAPRPQAPARTAPPAAKPPVANPVRAKAPAAPAPAAPARERVAPQPAQHTAKSNGSTGAAHSAPAADSTALNSQELEKFLINFVVEQTGYPPEIVELDADLEADLGIDSIKKAQLFGELGEYFEVRPQENVSMDDFPTLRHVLAVLLEMQGTAQAQAAPAKVVAPEPPVRPVSQSTAKSNGVHTAPAAHAAPSPAATSPAPAANAADLEKFLINFVVEQTGYPPEIVELDADLEADLGIDSIKKAQLFGELGEYFEVRPQENVSMDDFRTLRHVLAVLLEAQQTDAVLLEAQQSDSVQPANAVAPAPLAQPASPSPAKSNGVHTAAAPAPVAASPAAASPAPAANAADLEKFLINFVVEQTGYPPEIVELDADLEADLGIDSIKKAQLFGELGEYFEVRPQENVSMDDFRTLRHVLAVLLESQHTDPARSV